MNENSTHDNSTWSLGLSSYAYRWSTRPECASHTGSMDIPGLIQRAADLGLERAQICDNMSFDSLSKQAAAEIRHQANDLGVSIETGARGTNPDYLTRMIYVSRRLNSRLLRVVAEIDRNKPQNEVGDQLKQISEDLRVAAPIAEAEGLTIALENHSSLSSGDLLFIIASVDDESVRICLDTMNSITMLERPIETANALASLVVTIHLKDFRIIKRPDNFEILGVPLGEGMVDVVSILRSVEANTRLPSLHVELYVARKEDCEATRRYEDECVRRSVLHLKNVLRKL